MHLDVKKRLKKERDKANADIANLNRDATSNEAKASKNENTAKVFCVAADIGARFNFSLTLFVKVVLLSQVLLLLVQ